jgi:hypothetical protein
MDSDSVRGIDRRRLVRWGGLAAAGVAAGVPLVSAGLTHAGTTPAAPDSSGHDQIPPDTRMSPPARWSATQPDIRRSTDSHPRTAARLHQIGSPSSSVRPAESS